jgi:hypothetical protein
VKAYKGLEQGMPAIEAWLERQCARG